MVITLHEKSQMKNVREGMPMVRLISAFTAILAFAPATQAFDARFAEAAHSFATVGKTYDEAEALQVMAFRAAWSGEPDGEVVAMLLRSEEARRRSQYVTLFSRQIAGGDLAAPDASDHRWLMTEALKVAKASMDMADPADLTNMLEALRRLDHSMNVPNRTPMETIMSSIKDADPVTLEQFRMLAIPTLSEETTRPKKVDPSLAERLGRKWASLPGGQPIAKKVVAEHLVWTKDGLDKIADAMDGLGRAIRTGKVNEDELERLTLRVEKHFEKPVLGGLHDTEGNSFDALRLILDLCQREELAGICGKAFTDVKISLEGGMCAPLNCDCFNIQAGLLTGEFVKACVANQLSAQRACLEGGVITLGCAHPTGPGAYRGP